MCRSREKKRMCIYKIFNIAYIFLDLYLFNMLTRRAYRISMGLPEKPPPEPSLYTPEPPVKRRRGRSAVNESQTKKRGRRSVVNNMKQDDKNIRISLEIKIDNSSLTNATGPVPIVLNFGDFMKSMDLSNLINNGATINLAQGNDRKLVEDTSSSVVATSTPDTKGIKSNWWDESLNKRKAENRKRGRQKKVTSTPVKDVNSEKRPRGRPKVSLVPDDNPGIGANEATLAINPGVNDINHILNDSILNMFDGLEECGDLFSNEDLMTESQNQRNNLGILNNDYEADENGSKNYEKGEINSKDLVDQNENSDPWVIDKGEVQSQEGSKDSDDDLPLANRYGRIDDSEKNSNATDSNVTEPEANSNYADSVASISSITDVESTNSKRCSVKLTRCDEILKKIKKLQSQKIPKTLDEVLEKIKKSPCKKITKQLRLKDFILRKNRRKIKDKKIGNDVNVENNKNSDLQGNSRQETASSVDEAYESRSEASQESQESFVAGRIIDNIVSNLAESEGKKLDENSNRENREENNVLELLPSIEKSELNDSITENFENENVEDLNSLNLHELEILEEKKEENGSFLDYSLDIDESKPDFQEMGGNGENLTSATREMEGGHETLENPIDLVTCEEEKKDEIIACPEGAKDNTERPKEAEIIIETNEKSEKEKIDKIPCNSEPDEKLEKDKISPDSGKSPDKKELNAKPVSRCSTDSDTDSDSSSTSGSKKKPPAKKITFQKSKPNGFKSYGKREESSDSDSSSSSSSSSEKIKKLATRAKGIPTEKSKSEGLKSNQKNGKPPDSTESESDSSSSSSSSSTKIKKKPIPGKGVLTETSKITLQKSKPNELKSYGKGEESSDSDSSSSSSSSSGKIKKLPTSKKGIPTEKSKPEVLKTNQKNGKSPDSSESESDSSSSSSSTKIKKKPAKEVPTETSKPEEPKSNQENGKPPDSSESESDSSFSSGSSSTKTKKKQTPAKGVPTEISKPEEPKSNQKNGKPPDSSESESDSSFSSRSSSAKIKKKPAKDVPTETSKPEEPKSSYKKEKSSDVTCLRSVPSSSSKDVKKSGIPAEGSSDEKLKLNGLKSCQEIKKSPDGSSDSEKVKKSRLPAKGIPGEKSKPADLAPSQEREKLSDFDSDLSSNSKKNIKSEPPAEKIIPETPKYNEPKSYQKSRKSSSSSDTSYISDLEPEGTSKPTIVLRKRKERKKTPDYIAELDKSDGDFSADEDTWEPPKIEKKKSRKSDVNPSILETTRIKKKSKIEKKSTISVLPGKKSNGNDEFRASDGESVLSVEKDDPFEKCRPKKIKKITKPKLKVPPNIKAYLMSREPSSKGKIGSTKNLSTHTKNKLLLLDTIIKQEMQKYGPKREANTDSDSKSEISVLDVEEIQRSCLQQEMLRRSFSKPTEDKKSISSSRKTEEIKKKKKNKSKKSKDKKMEKTDIDISPLPKSISSQLKTVKPTVKIPQKIVNKSKPKRKAEEDIPVPQPSKKVSSDGYIPLKVDGPTKFGISTMNKLSKAVPYRHHAAADFKAKMLDRNKRISSKQLISLKEKRNQLK